LDLLYFVLLVGALVLVHELGHFAAARAFGVRVLTFSIGFGPTLLQLRGRETTYRFALLPFGGFVKLLEEPKKGARGGAAAEASDEGDALREEDVGRTLQAQALWKRIIITLAGPAMNLLAPVFLFFAVFLAPTRTVPPMIGLALPGSPADGVLRPGDLVLEAGGEEIDSYAELQAKIQASPGRKLTLRVARPQGDPLPGQPRGKEDVLELSVVPRAVSEPRELGGNALVGRLGIGPAPLAATIGVRDVASPAYRAGLRTFDVITHVGGVPTPRFVDVERRLRDNLGTAVPVNYLRPRGAPWPKASDGENADKRDKAAPLAEAAVFEARVAVLAPEAAPSSDGRGLERAGIENADLYVASVPEGSSEDRMGLRRGDRLEKLDGAPIRSWQAFVEDLASAGERTREVAWIRGGRPMSGLFRVRKEEWTDPTGVAVERYVFRTTHWTPTLPWPLDEEEADVGRAMRLAVVETGSLVKFLAVSGVRLLQGKISVEAISGPLAIYDAAGRAGARGTRDFVWVMALVSANLGLLNLLPIPILDGGQLLFFAIEAVARRPLPMRVRAVMTFVGLVLLLLLMIVALRNDLGRHWDGVFSPLRDGAR
jgi:regulator of sigma E protease